MECHERVSLNTKFLHKYNLKTAEMRDNFCYLFLITTSHEKVFSYRAYFNYASVSWKQWNVSAVHVNVRESYIRSKMSCVFRRPTVLSKNSKSIQQVFKTLSLARMHALSLVCYWSMALSTTSCFSSAQTETSRCFRSLMSRISAW